MAVYAMVAAATMIIAPSAKEEKYSALAWPYSCWRRQARDAMVSAMTAPTAATRFTMDSEASESRPTDDGDSERDELDRHGRSQLPPPTTRRIGPASAVVVHGHIHSVSRSVILLVSRRAPSHHEPRNSSATGKPRAPLRRRDRAPAGAAFRQASSGDRNRACRKRSGGASGSRVVRGLLRPSVRPRVPSA